MAVIVPIYNDEGTLEACIKSIQQQTYDKIEIILVDDGSTDNSGGICDKFKDTDSRIKVIHQTNRGVSGARNTGLSISNAELFCFVDADDEVTLDYVEILISSFNENFSDLIVSGMKIYEDKSTKYLSEKTNMLYLQGITEEECKRLFSMELMMMPVGKLYKKEILTRHNICFLEGLTCGEDNLFVMEYLEHCTTVHFIDKYTYNYYIFRSRSTKRFFALIGQTKVFEAKCRFVNKHFIDKNPLFVKQYISQKALHNLWARNKYLIQNEIKSNSEIEKMYSYYWEYIFPYENKENYFDKKDLEWLEKNKKDLKERDFKNIYKKEKKLYKKPFKKRVARKIIKIITKE